MLVKANQEYIDAQFEVRTFPMGILQEWLPFRFKTKPPEDLLEHREKYKEWLKDNYIAPFIEVS